MSNQTKGATGPFFINIIMKTLNEYQHEIRNDDDLNRWKANWDGVSEPPQHVVKYMNTVVLPRLLLMADELLYLPSSVKNENF